MNPQNPFKIPNSESQDLLQQRPQSTFPNRPLAPASISVSRLFLAHPSEPDSLFLLQVQLQTFYPPFEFISNAPQIHVPVEGSWMRARADCSQAGVTLEIPG